MILIQDASFKKPKGKNWQKKYVQLDFSASIKELEQAAKDLRKEGKKTRHFYKKEKDFIEQTWCLTAFMEKCQCSYCKPGWDAHEKATEERELEEEFVKSIKKNSVCSGHHIIVGDKDIDCFIKRLEKVSGLGLPKAFGGKK